MGKSYITAANSGSEMENLFFLFKLKEVTVQCPYLKCGGVLFTRFLISYTSFLGLHYLAPARPLEP
jgi:hypothetical protein